MEEIRVRFPPSPTGYLHIGSARTALYNWLFARGQGGKLVFRIEDTDAERSTDESEKAIVEGLEWLGIDWDEGPYRQSERIDLHKSEAGRLVHEGKAYLCFCSKDDLDAKRKQAESRKETYHYDRTCLHMDPEERERRIQASDPFVVRFRRPDGPGSVTFDDLVYGMARGGVWRGTSDYLAKTLHARLALGCAPLVLGLFAMAVGLLTPSGGRRVRDFLLAFAPPILLYFPLYIGGMSMRTFETIPPWAALWAANIVVGLLAMGLLLRAFRR